MSVLLSIRTSARCPDCNRRLEATPISEDRNSFFAAEDDVRSVDTMQIQLVCSDFCWFGFFVSMAKPQGDCKRIPNLQKIRQNVFDKIPATDKQRSEEVQRAS